MYHVTYTKYRNQFIYKMFYRMTDPRTCSKNKIRVRFNYISLYERGDVHPFIYALMRFSNL